MRDRQDLFRVFENQVRLIDPEPEKLNVYLTESFRWDRKMAPTERDYRSSYFLLSEEDSRPVPQTSTK